MSDSTSPFKFDVLGLGCCAVDTLLNVASYPPADSKMPVTCRRTQFGGLTGTALISAARLGARCAYAGRLGTDAASTFTASHLENEGIDVSHAPRLADANVVESTIIVADDSGSRNIFFHCKGKIGAHESLPREDIIRSARVLFLDYFGMEGNLRAARIARANGIPIVADFEEEKLPLFSEVFDILDHPIVSADMARRVTGLSDPREAARALWNDSRAVVVVTCGAEGCWSLTATDREPRHNRAYRVQAVDTTGCGDVFHGAYAAALAQGLPLDARIRFASAAAAIKATRSDPPDLAAVQNLMNSQSLGS